MQNSTIQIRIDSKTKRKARETLEEVGLDLSSGIKLFLHNVALTESVPLDIRTANGFTLMQEQRLLHALDDARKNKKTHASSRALHRSSLRTAKTTVN